MKLTAREWLLLPEAEQMQRGKELSPEECFKLRMELSEVNFTEEEKQKLTKEERGETKIKRVPFSDEEIMKLWDNITYPFTDMVLIGIYSGWRPQELAILKIADIDLDNWSFTGGLKTDAGRNRTIPIHPAIQKLVKQNYDKAIQMHSAYLFNDQNGQQGTYLTYDKYRGRFNKVMMKLNLKHKPHDTRHTFINAAKAANMNEYVLKIIVGHVIEDVTEAVYTHRTVDQLREELIKIDLPNP